MLEIIKNSEGKLELTEVDKRKKEIGEIRGWLEDDLQFTWEKLDEDAREKLKYVLDWEDYTTLIMEEEDAYVHACRTTNHNFPIAVERAYEFWKDYKDYIFGIGGRGEKFARKWLIN